MTRTALLIGVARTPGAPGFDSLDEPVAADLANLREALESSSYDVHVLENPDHAQIGTTIFELARKIPEDGTFLVYFTGHGLRHANTDYLLPANALEPPDGEWSEVYLDSLRSTDIGRYLQQCRAGTVLWLIDACRDEVEGPAFGSRVQGPPSGGFAVMVGCDVGERCGYSAEGSYFTKGLVEAFSSMSAPRTVHEVYEAVRSATSRLAGKNGSKQRVQIRYGTDREEETRETRICAGRHLMDEWRAVVTDERLWCLATSSDQVQNLQGHLLSLVEACARQVQHADKRLFDRWSDDDFAPRLLLRTLPLIVPRESCFSPAEVASLIAAVFLHEAAWADKRSQAADADPHQAGRQPEADVHRRHLEQVHDQYAHVARKLDLLPSRGKLDDRDNVALWLVHRWIAERFETDEKPIPPDLADTFARAVLGTRDSGRVDEFASALCRLAAGTGTEPPLDAVVDCATRKVVLQGEKQPFRERPLAALLRLAGILSVDARVFPEVVAEHLGASDPLSPQDVMATVREFVHWSDEELALDMDASCPHQALHAGLEEIVERADRLVTQTRKLAEDLPEPERALLARIPDRVTATGLRPRQADGQKAYEIPLLRFQLAQNEVRELLMGKQLYGSPDLALRELYQNAMDACRYRAMRWEYLHRLGKHPADWDGRISIVQGDDPRGRYVECRDNGVGMGWDQLINTFTRAGSRFEQSRVFRQEQAAWLRFDPALRLYPNSRFGIGVFSYFMLADEMTIVTRPVSREGVQAQDAWRVEISSSGSLFRILKHTEPDDGVAEGGTRVRLYLRDDKDLKRLSCTKTLGSLVAVSEFHLEVRDTSGDLRWEPGVLYPNRAHKSTSSQVAVPGVLWWVNGDGAILCDGIATGSEVFGYVLNLTGTHAGELSVNRKELLSYDKGWESHNWVQGASQLLSWPDFTMNWWWLLESKNFPVARVIWQVIKGKGVQVHEKGTGTPRDIDSLGVTWIDQEIIEPGVRYPDHEAKDFFLPWRTAALGHPYFDARAPRSLIGHPVMEPGDAEICKGDSSRWMLTHSRPPQDWTWVIAIAGNKAMTVAEVVRSLRRSRIAHPTLAPPRVLTGELSWRPASTDLMFVDELFGREDGRLMSGGTDLRDLVVVSRRLEMSFGELADVCSRYTPLRLVSPPEVPPQHREYICTDDDLAALYLVDQPERPLPPELTMRRVTHPGDVCEAAARRGSSTEAVLEHLRQFGWLGWIAPSAEAVDVWATVHEKDAYRLLREFSGDEQTLDWTATVVFAAERGLTLGQAESELARLAELTGLTYARRIPLESKSSDLVPSAVVARLLSVARRRGGIAVTQGLTMDDLALYTPDSIAVERYADIVNELAEMGISAPSYPMLFESWKDLPLRSRYAFSGNVPGGQGPNYPTEPTAAVLFMASFRLKESLKDMWELVRIDAAHFGLSVPDLPKTLADYQPTWREVNVLMNAGGLRPSNRLTPEWVDVTMFGLARYALETKLNGRAAYEQLASLRPLGALVPELPVEALQSLETSTPDARDLLALEGTHRVTEADEPLVPLDLVSIAARLGELISETWQRFVPYLPFTVEPAVSHFPDVIPRWQDFAILTKYLDGLLPAIEGRVEPAHVEFVAREIGESEEWVWARLRLYESMFDLDLSDMPGEED